MAFSTIISKFPGRCRRCYAAGLPGDKDTAGPAQVKTGQKVRYGGRGMVWHLASECPASQMGAQNERQPEDTGRLHEDMLAGG